MTQKQTQLAVNYNNKLVFASELTNNDRGKVYFCIECHQRKYYTHGSVTSPHFRNFRGSTCACTSESNLHKAIKRLIMDHFNGSAEEEYSSSKITKKINRRADVFLHSEKPVVFEIQVSSISKEEVNGRTRDWQSVGCEVIWIPTIQNQSQIFRFGSFLKFDENNVNKFMKNLNNYQNFYMNNLITISTENPILNLNKKIEGELINDNKKKLIKIIEKRLLNNKYIPDVGDWSGTGKQILNVIMDIDKGTNTLIERAPFIKSKDYTKYDYAIGMKMKSWKISAPDCFDILSEFGTIKAQKDSRYVLFKVLSVYF